MIVDGLDASDAAMKDLEMFYMEEELSSRRCELPADARN